MSMIKLDNININYKKVGNGQPLILLHGLGNNSESFESQIEGLKESFTVIAWDAPGYGQSSDMKQLFKTFSEFSDVLYEFIEELNYDSVYLLGHSMGAAIAVDFANRFPDKVEKLILADPTRGAASITEEQNKTNLANRIKAVDELSGEELAEQRVPNLLSDNVTKDVLDNAKRIMAQVRPSGYKSVAHSLSNLDQMDIYPNIKQDTLVICGEVDRVTPVKESVIINDLIPKSQLRIIPDAGHLCYQEKPELFNNIVYEFLNE